MSTTPKSRSWLHRKERKTDKEIRDGGFRLAQSGIVLQLQIVALEGAGGFIPLKTSENFAAFRPGLLLLFQHLKEVRL